LPVLPIANRQNCPVIALGFAGKLCETKDLDGFPLKIDLKSRNVSSSRLSVKIDHRLRKCIKTISGSQLLIFSASQSHQNSEHRYLHEMLDFTGFIHVQQRPFKTRYALSHCKYWTYNRTVLAIC
jgi:hypothetical protein